MRGKKLVLLLALFVLAVRPVGAVDYGSSPNLDNSWKGLPVCEKAKPKPPVLYQPNHPALPKAKGPGEIRLQWTKVPGASGYNVYYGLSPRNYIYSVPNLGDTDSYTVGYLGNRVYYFAVQTKDSCATSGFSNEWGARPGGGGINLLTSAPGVVPVQLSAPVNERQNEQNVNSQDQGTFQPSAVTPPAPKAVVPKKTTPNFFQSLFSFFSSLFGRK